MTSNSHDAFFSKVNNNIHCETLFPKQICVYWYTYLQDIASLHDWFYIDL